MRFSKTSRLAITLLSFLALGACALEVDSGAERSGKIPITTRSDEARELYLDGRRLAENIHQAEAREKFEGAVAADPEFALAHLALANTARSAQEFFDDLERAVELAENASEGERLMILGTDAGARGDPMAQREYFTQLVELHPEDERAHFLLAGFHFGRQEYDLAIASYREATEINPQFPLAYNLLGYAYRSTGQIEEAEEAFKRYIELTPDEPNPYDSYAELLMKVGRFEESIANYRKALDLDPSFIPSYVGIANNQMFLGRTGEARETLQELLEMARNDGERRQALFWIAASYLHDEDPEAAVEAARRMREVAVEGGDWAQVAGDHALVGTIFLDTGDAASALAEFDSGLEAIARATVNDDVKAGFRRNHIYRQARAALEEGDLERVRELTEAYAEAVAERNIPAEVRRVHELQGLIALREGDWPEAISHLQQANQQDPRVLYRLAVAYREAGQPEAARELAEEAANWNQLGFNYGFVRRDARQLLRELDAADG